MLLFCQAPAARPCHTGTSAEVVPPAGLSSRNSPIFCEAPNTALSYRPLEMLQHWSSPFQQVASRGNEPGGVCHLLPAVYHSWQFCLFFFFFYLKISYIFQSRSFHPSSFKIAVGYLLLALLCGLYVPPCI